MTPTGLAGHTDTVSTVTGVPGVSGVVDIIDRADQHRYELRVDEEVRGLAVYSDADDVRAIVHTEIDVQLQRHGLAGRLVRRVLDDARRDHRTVVPACPYVEWYIEQHPEFGSLVRPRP